MSLDTAVMDMDEALRTLEIVGAKKGLIDITMQVKTQRSGELAGESSRKYEDGKPRHDVLGYYFAAGTPSDAGTGLSTGRRRYTALRVVRNSDASTASLMSAFATNDTLTVDLSSYKAGGDGSEVAKPFFRILLKNARVKTFTLMAGTALPNTGAVEIIELFFRTVTIESAPQQQAGDRGAVRTFEDTMSESL
jgi:type VI protein secretion system component Hcp